MELNDEEKKALESIETWATLLKEFHECDLRESFTSSLYFLAMSVDQACKVFGVESDMQIALRHAQDQIARQRGTAVHAIVEKAIQEVGK